MHEMERKVREKNSMDKNLTDKLKSEAADLRARFEQMAHELRFSIEDELRIYARLLDELMKRSSAATATATHTASMYTSQATASRSSGIEETSTTSATNAIFDLAGSHSGWPTPTSLSLSTENLFRVTENEIHETYDGSSVIRSSSFSTLD